MRTILLSLALLLPIVGSAQTYSLDWFVVAGGGDTSSDDTYEVTGTIGQADASDALIDGEVSLTGGFWSFLNDDLLIPPATGNAPVAFNDLLGAVINQPVNLPAAKLTTNDTDIDEDLLTITVVSASSSQGGTAALVAGTVTYSPPPDFTGADSFTYTIGDGHGNSATGTVNVTIFSDTGSPPSLVYGPVMDQGEFVMRFIGLPGCSYTLEYTGGLGLGGPILWQKLANLTAPNTADGFGVGVFEFRESVSSTESRFYRTVYPAY